MRRYPRVSDTEDRFNEAGNKLCRNCENIVSMNRKHYCSKNCMEEFNRNNTWFFVRKDILRRDNYRCNFCEKRFKKTQLEVDHIVPLRMGGQYFDKENLRTLCKECHSAKSKLDHSVLKEIGK